MLSKLHKIIIIVILIIIFLSFIIYFSRNKYLDLIKQINYKNNINLEVFEFTLLDIAHNPDNYKDSYNLNKNIKFHYEETDFNKSINLYNSNNKLFTLPLNYNCKTADLKNKLCFINNNKLYITFDNKINNNINELKHLNKIDIYNQKYTDSCLLQAVCFCYEYHCIKKNIKFKPSKLFIYIVMHNFIPGNNRFPDNKLSLYNRFTNPNNYMISYDIMISNMMMYGTCDSKDFEFHDDHLTNGIKEVNLFNKEEINIFNKNIEIVHKNNEILFDQFDDIHNYIDDAKKHRILNYYKFNCNIDNIKKYIDKDYPVFFIINYSLLRSLLYYVPKNEEEKQNIRFNYSDIIDEINKFNTWMKYNNINLDDLYKYYLVMASTVGNIDLHLINIIQKIKEKINYKSNDNFNKYIDKLIAIITNLNDSIHGLAIVGYNDDKRYFKLRNSWGIESGRDDNGYFYFSYDLFDENYYLNNGLIFKNLDDSISELIPKFVYDFNIITHTTDDPQFNNKFEL
tara:strand:- start:7445 stop:8977 length:1533 start_codon:yes stop_codon:yes gene_type:complete